MSKIMTEEQIELCKELIAQGKSYYECSRYLLKQFDVVVNPECIRWNCVRKHADKIPMVEKLKNDGIEKVLVISDIHIPFNRSDILDIVEKHKDEISTIVLNGDIIDCKSISKFVELGRGSLIDEMAACHELLKRIDDLTPAIRKVIVLGNHSIRLSKYMASNPNELNNLHTDNILREIVEGFKKVDHEKGKVIYYNKLNNYEVLDDWYFEYKKIIFCHPTSFSKVPAKTAYNAVEYFVRNGFDFDTCIVAHTHHYGACKNLGKYTIETGCLCRPMPYSQTGKLNFVPQDYGYHLAVLRNGKYDVNLSRNFLLEEEN